MPVTVRPASLESDRDAVIGLLARHLNPAYDATRFEWLYTRNPEGKGRLWVALDTGTGEIVGSAAAFPRRVTVGGREAGCWVLGDFCVNERYRALGPALTLQRACLALADEAGIAFCYDFPSRAMMTVYRRLRVSPIGQMRRLVKTVKVDWRLGRLIRLPALRRTVALAGQRLLASTHRRVKKPAELVVALQQEPCDEAFTRLWEAEAGGYDVCLKRTAAYLNWRYRENPIARHEILTARVGDRLLGYAVFTTVGESAVLVDLFGSRDTNTLQVLTQEVADLVRRRGCVNLSVSLVDSHRWTGMFRQLGFMPREADPVILSWSPDRAASAFPPVADRLFFMSGDRDS